MTTPLNYLCSFGETLWDLLPSGKQPGGAPMNVALHLQKLGIRCFMISRVGDDALGNEILQFIRAKQGNTDWIQKDPVHPTGTVNVTLSEKGPSYEIVQPVAWDFILTDPGLKDLVQNAYGIVFGSLACRSSESRRTLFRLLMSARIKIFDVNLRPPYFSQPLVYFLMKQSTIVKMNEEELNIISAWHGGKVRLKTKMKYLAKRFKLQTIIVTRGENGAILFHDDHFYESPGHKVEVVDTVGSGDAFLAGYLKQIIEGKNQQEALDHACALGALVAMHAGANPDIRDKDLEPGFLRLSGFGGK